MYLYIENRRTNEQNHRNTNVCILFLKKSTKDYEKHDYELIQK